MASRRMIDHEEVFVLWRQGIKVNIIAERTGFREDSIRKSLNARGIFLNERLNRVQIRLFVYAGLADVEIADVMHSRRDSVARVRLSMGLAPNKKEPRRRKPRVDKVLIEKLLRDGMGISDIARRAECTDSYVSKIRVELGIAAKVGPLPPLSVRLVAAEELLDDGASFAEVMRSVQISRDSLRKHFPGRQWTAKQAGEHAMAVRYGEKVLDDIWPGYAGGLHLTKPPLTK